MKGLIVMGMMVVFLALGLWETFSAIHPGQQSKLTQHARLALEIK